MFLKPNSWRRTRAFNTSLILPLYRYIAEENIAKAEFLSTCFQKIEDLGVRSAHCYI